MVDIIKQDMTDIWAVGGDVVAPDSAKVRAGWGVETVPRQWWNWFENRQDTNIAYMLQKGIPEWDQFTEYLTNKSYVQRNNIVYKCILTGVNKDPVTTPANWVKAFVDSTPYFEKLKTVPVAPTTMLIINSLGNADTVPYGTTGLSVLATTTPLAARTAISAQAATSNLTALSGVTPAINALPYFTSATAMSTTSLTAFGRSLIAALDAVATKTLLELQNVNNTSDISKPVSTAQQAALNLKVDKTISVIAGIGLTGGGTLATNSTFDISPGQVPATAIQLTTHDLNNITAPGFYFQPANASATLALNYPVVLAGALVVTTAASGVVQEYTAYGPSRRKYFRSSYAGVWSAWTQLFSSFTTLDIGTTAASARTALELNAASYAATTTGSGSAVLHTSPVFAGAPLVPTAAIGTNNSQIANTAFVLANASANPAGAILAYAGASLPAGYVRCDGSVLGRVAYAELFQAIGTVYGVGNGSTTFNLPDLRGEFLRGLDIGRGVDVGRAIGTWQGPQIGDHAHTFTGTAYGGHTHTASAVADGVHTHTLSGSTSSSGDHFHTIPTRNGGGIVGGGYIAASPAQGGTYNVNTPTDGDHVHTISGTAASAGSHSHAISVAAGGAFTPAGTVNANGGTHNLGETRPRNVAVQFLIKY